MARIRTIKPRFFTSATVASLPLSARLTFIGLWTMADDEGRLEYDPRLVKAALWALDDDVTARDVEADIAALTELSVITHYIVGEGARRREYLAITNWVEHQKINRPSASILPGPESGVSAGQTPFTEASLNTHEDSVNAHGGLTVGKEEGREKEKEEGSEMSASAAKPHPLSEELCETLADLIEANGSRRPNISKAWRDAARLMIDKDQRDPEEIRAVMAWSQSEPFWKPNILSMEKLREKYDTLRLQREQKLKKEAPAGRPSPWDTFKDDPHPYANQHAQPARPLSGWGQAPDEVTS